MNREIKFRAWHKEYKKMLVVYVIHQGTYWEGFVKNCQGFVPPNEQYVFKFDEAEWMQYTGLKDKNGKEIYEGDIIQDNVGRYWVIRYDNKYCAFMFYYTKGMHQFQHYERFNKFQRPFEIIGNIFENPKLLK